MNKNINIVEFNKDMIGHLESLTEMINFYGYLTPEDWIKKLDNIKKMAENAMNPDNEE